LERDAKGFAPGVAALNKVERRRFAREDLAGSAAKRLKQIDCPPKRSRDEKYGRLITGNGVRLLEKRVWMHPA